MIPLYAVSGGVDMVSNIAVKCDEIKKLISEIMGFVRIF